MNGLGGINPQRRNTPNDFKIHHETVPKDKRNGKKKKDKKVIFANHFVDDNVNFETVVVNLESKQMSNYVSMVEDSPDFLEPPISSSNKWGQYFTRCQV